MPRCSALLAILVQINQLFELLKMVGFNKRDMPKIFRAAGKDVMIFIFHLFREFLTKPDQIIHSLKFIHFSLFINRAFCFLGHQDDISHIYPRIMVRNRPAGRFN